MSKYYVSQWALLRKSEIIDLPEDFEIHSDYLKILGKDKIVSTIKNIRQMFVNVYQDIADFPERFKMPMIEIIEEERTKMGSPPAKALSSKWAPFRFFDVLINILISCHIENGVLIAKDPEKIIEANKTQKMIKLVDHKLQNIDALYSQFDRYGLFLEGLKNYKFTKDTVQVTLNYPDDPDFLVVLKWMADKAHKFERRRDFMLCQYRLLQDGMDSLHYGFGADYIADRLHTKEEQDCVYKLDAALCENGHITHIDGAGYTTETGYDSLFYYENEQDKGNLDKSNFRVRADKKLYLRIRVKNIQNGVEHIKQCSDELKSNFVPGDKGCVNRGNCVKQKMGGGQAYVIDGVEYWKCGCAGGNFVTLQPRSEDIADYIKLVELFNQ
jgi:hypothetical protein